MLAPLGAREAHTLHKFNNAMTFQELYFSAEGRINRQTYWLRGLLPFFVIIALFYTVVLTTKSIALMAILGLVLLAAAIGMVFLEIKRWHDRGKPGTWWFIRFVPFIGTLWVLVECGFLPGTEGDNDFGPDPMQDADYMEV